MILLDLNQVMISNMMRQLGRHADSDVDEGLLRHMILNSIRSYRAKFSGEYGELIICADDKNYWRKDVYPFYKANRKKSRESSGIDWNSIFESLNKIRDELKEFFPYKVIQIDRAEADDVIGTIVHKEGVELGNTPPILILSGDKDYIQLHIYSNVKQYDPVGKRWITDNDPESYLFDHIVRGDAGDGVPNVFSADDSLVNGTRQTPVTKKRMEQMREQVAKGTMPTDVARNYYRNRTMIDLSMINPTIVSEVEKAYSRDDHGDRSQLFNYFVSRKLKFLMEYIQDF